MTEPTSISESRVDPALAIELVKAKSSEIRDVFAHYYRAVALYIAMTGALLKFATDKDATPALRVGMATFGIAISLLGIATCILSRRYQKQASEEQRAMRQALQLGPDASELMPFRYMTGFILTFTSLMIAGWILILLVHPTINVGPVP